MKKQNGFTVLELLVVVAIIGILAGILFVAINPKGQTEKANVSRTVQDLRAIKDAIAFYVLDTGVLPPDCGLNCRPNTDPLINSLGIAGWRGPYLTGGVYNRKHPWGGHIGIYSYDSNGNGKDEVWVMLDEDAPMTNSSDNSAKIPQESLEQIDKFVDDGVLATGSFFRGNGVDGHVSGEASWRVYRIGEY